MATAKKATLKKVVVKRITSNKPKRVSPWTWIVRADGDDIKFYKNDEEICNFNLENEEKLTCSCGVKEIDGIAQLQKCIDIYRVPLSVVKAALKGLIADIKQNDAAFVIASNNQDTPEINRILNSLSITKTDWALNPNSGNQIRVWIL